MTHFLRILWDWRQDLNVRGLWNCVLHLYIALWIALEANVYFLLTIYVALIRNGAGGIAWLVSNATRTRLLQLTVQECNSFGQRRGNIFSSQSKSGERGTDGAWLNCKLIERLFMNACWLKMLIRLVFEWDLQGKKVEIIPRQSNVSFCCPKQILT